MRSITTTAAISLMGMLSAIGAGEGTPSLTENKWVCLSEGKFERSPGNLPDRRLSKLVWAPKLDRGVMLPQTGSHSREEVMIFDPIRRTWIDGKRYSSLEHRSMGGRNPLGYLYLPKQEKIFMLKRQKYSTREPVQGWLVDPATEDWTPIPGNLSMSDRSADFNPSESLDERLPLWGMICFDGYNQEIVSFGGAGTWGRVSRDPEQAEPGDWIFDESADPKRIRRLTPGESGKKRLARRWYPAHCGTWISADTGRAWTALPQPLREQPSARMYANMVYDAAESKIVLFGGDDQSRCLSDTWILDCKTKVWRRVHPEISPPARGGFAMVYVPGEEAILLAGGYSPGWKRGLRDVWLYHTKANEWTRLDLDLPIEAMYATADYDPKRKAIVLAAYKLGRFNQEIPVYALRLNAVTAPKAAASKAAKVESEFHCVNHYHDPEPLPDGWLTGEFAPAPPEEGRAALAELPANTWVQRQPPVAPYRHAWGHFPYDPKTHTVFAWGGGHGGNHTSAGIHEYDVLLDRWRGMADPPNYKPRGEHGYAGPTPGIGLAGWSLIPSHARKSYVVDPVSECLITYVGDVYSIKHHMFVANIGRCPGKYDVSTQVAFAAAPHGLYGYSEGLLVKADVASATWKTVAKGGPPRHYEFDFMVYDPKRDRLLYFDRETANVWAFSFASMHWNREEPEGKPPVWALGDGTYIPELDAVLMIFALKGQTAQDECLYFYKLAERRWYWAPYQGERYEHRRVEGKNASPHYDPKLGVVVRVLCDANDKFMRIFAMRLDHEKIKMHPVE